ncbi:MAG: MmgE/PrpD family protein [Propionibacteriales bacterium]|nr:MmgE/PrpD family protein [Propionibacteriales bacterium]
MEMSLTEYVADFTLGLRYDDIPEAVRSTAIEHILDGYGLTLSGVAEESHRVMRRYLERVASAGEVTVFGTPLRTSVELAALVNGLAIHAMDYDDTQLSTNPESVYGLLTHPTAPVLAATSAVAEAVGASGRDLLTAYVAGVEVACRTADASNPRHYQKGFHSTGTFGAIGAVAGAGKLLGLSRGQLLHALGSAASLSGGYRESFGTMTKPLHAGNAARAGVFAARLAGDGFTAARNILEADRGMYAASSDGYDPARIEGRLGSPFFLDDPGVSIKPYPSGSLSHPGQDAVLELVREHDITPDQVEEAIAGTNSAMPNALIYRMPTTSLEAKFSFPFFLAIAILRRKVGIEEFRDEVVRSPEVQEMMERCHHVVDQEIDAAGFQHMDTRVTIRLKDGTVVERVEAFATGHPRKPMSREQLEAKFFECADLAIGKDQARMAADAIWGIEGLDDVARLHKTLEGTP